MNHYERLEVAPDATEQTIKAAYRRLAKRYHPDVNGGSREAEAIFKQVQQAYEVLGDAEARRQYDAKLAGGPNPAPKPQAAAKPRASAFENFFGFNPDPDRQGAVRPDERSKGSNGPNGPIDTEGLFRRFFGGK